MNFLALGLLLPQLALAQSAAVGTDLEYREPELEKKKGERLEVSRRLRFGAARQA